LTKNPVKRAACALALTLLGSGLYAQTKNLTNIDTPTAFTAERGAYNISLLEYDNGGLEFKALIGLASFFHLGASFDVQNAIGKDRMKPNIPGVIAKVKFTDGWESWPIGIAAGYDSFFISEQEKHENNSNPLDRMIYGPYIAITKPIYLFDDEQYISFGARRPTQPHYVPNDASYYAAVDFPLNSMFRIKGEMERVYWNLRASKEWLYNLGMRYTYMNQLGIEFDLLFQYKERVNRVVRIEYHDFF
jgi:hypothetical protein